MKSKEMKNIPTLRFPEFLNDSDWEIDEFRQKFLEVIDGDRGKNYPKSNEFSTSGYCLFLNAKNVTKNGFVFDEVSFITHGKDNLLRKGKLKPFDIVLTTRGSVGNFAYFSSNVPYGNIRINSGMVILRVNSELIKSDYLYYYCKSDYMSKKIQDTAFGNAQQQLTVSQIKKFQLTFPKPKEQKKIADFLNSIDNLITAQSKKVEALKEHKKGLMQQLFPTDGEKVPKRRFPEFLNDGEWEEKPLGKICDYWNGGSHENSVTENGQYYLISLNSLDIEGTLKTDMKKVDYLDNSLQKNDLVMVLSDVAHGNFLGLTAIIPNDNYVLNQRMAGLRKKENEKIDMSFLRLYINNNQKYFKKHGQGSSQLNLSKSSVTDFPVMLPLTEEEQQKIADCLSSIDNLITAQSKKVETLKEHKKGLMQQLFPSGDEK
jgi:type I restriction enzyme, S subunit